MLNFLQPGDAIAVVSPTGGLVSGQAVQIGYLFGVAAYTAAAGASAEIVTKGVFTLPKAATIVFAQGDKAYWDPVAGNLTSIGTGHSWVGVATVPAAASATTANIRLNQAPV